MTKPPPAYKTAKITANEHGAKNHTKTASIPTIAGAQNIKTILEGLNQVDPQRLSNVFPRFYDEVEKTFCGELKSGFGRNLDALNDMFTSGYGKVYKHLQNKEKIFINFNNSKILPCRVKNTLENIIRKNEENKTNDLIQISLQ